MDSEMLKLVYDISRKIAGECFPDELIYFDELWDVLEPALSKSVPVGLAVPEPQERAAFFAPDDLHLLELPSFSIIECVQSAVYYYLTRGEFPNAPEFKNLVVETLRKNHRFSKKDAEPLSQVAWRLLAADLGRIPAPVLAASHISKPPVPQEELYFTVRTEEGKRDGTEEEYLEKYAVPPLSNEKEPLVWANLVTYTYSLWVRDRRREVALAEPKRKLLRKFLRSFNKPILINELRATVDYHDQILKELRDATFGVLDPFIAKQTGEFRILKPYSKYSRKRKFTFCLIEEYEATGGCK